MQKTAGMPLESNIYMMSWTMSQTFSAKTIRMKPGWCIMMQEKSSASTMQQAASFPSSMILPAGGRKYGQPGTAARAMNMMPWAT